MITNKLIFNYYYGFNNVCNVLVIHYEIYNIYVFCHGWKPNDAW